MSEEAKKGTAVIVIGMAGSGKTTLLQRLNSYLHTQKTPPYLVNLDPAVAKLPFTAKCALFCSATSGQCSYCATASTYETQSTTKKL